MCRPESFVVKVARGYNSNSHQSGVFMRSLSLTKKFVLYSLIIIVVIGIFAGRTLIMYTERHISQNFVNHTVLIQEILKGTLKESDFEQDKKNLTSSDFDKRIKKYVDKQGLVAIKIWSRKGEVLYSNSKGLIGKKFRVDDDLKKAFNGKLSYEESDLSDVENVFERPKYNSLLEIYSPVLINGRSVGAFESYFSMDPVIESVKKITLSIVILLSLGLGLLWITLSGLVNKASKTINQQNAQIKEFADQQVVSLKEIKEHYFGTIRSLAMAVEARDPYTSGHSNRTSHLSLQIGRQLRLPKEQLSILARAGMLHDIGKIGMPDSILSKNGPLTPQEWEKVKEHPIVSSTIVDSIPFLREISEIVKHHHEHYDGKGYPDGLASDSIPLEAQILSVADAHDAMTSDRPYRKALSTEEALRRLEEGKGQQFAPEIVEAFKTVIFTDINKG